eukprot:2391370-Heterocapsa_arctica.AAC.1
MDEKASDEPISMTGDLMKQNALALRQSNTRRCLPPFLWTKNGVIRARRSKHPRMRPRLTSEDTKV